MIVTLCLLPLHGGGQGGGYWKIDRKLINIARSLRKRSTDTERFLWRHIRAKQLEGLKFRRQQPIGNYIVDFVCFEKRVIIELDGGQHSFDAEMKKDVIRDKWFEKQGYKVLRFWNNDVSKNMNGIIEMIRDACL